jgi:dihydroxy-acid dehydratase
MQKGVEVKLFYLICAIFLPLFACFQGGSGLDALITMEAIATYSSGQMSKEKFEAIEANALPGPGTCSAMFTANTMSSAVEALGLSPPHTASRPAVSVPTVQ